MGEHDHLNSIIIILLAGIVGVGFLFYNEYYLAIKPAITEPPKQVKNIQEDRRNSTTTEKKNNTNNENNTSTQQKNLKKKNLKIGKNKTNIPLSVPEGFKIEVLTNKVPEARDIEKGPRGNLWVSRTDKGAITMIDLDSDDGKLGNVQDIFTDMYNPHGIEFHPENKFQLYIAEEDKISKVTLYSEKSSLETVANLPTGGRHYTRSLEFGPNNNLFASIGSTCDVCKEENSKHGTIQKVNTNTGELTQYATGLRNAVFFEWSSINNKMWATEMGRDNLGDDLPPDEINIIERGQDYGWPLCYSDNIYDKKFNGAPNKETPCQDKEPSHIDLQAHVAPLGFDFVPTSTTWSEKYKDDLLVAYHGSWNRSVPVGYKIKWIKLNENRELKNRD
ncbi:MAG: hypothetical protein BRC22_01465, partial [Parcubacteria group bacterium QH_9_35_7]